MATQPATLLEQVEAPAEALAPVTAPADAFLAMVERLALVHDLDVAKFEKILDMQERVLNRNAESAFNVAFSAMQGDLPEIEENGAIKNREGQIQSRFAKWEDIKKAITPVLSRHGFALRHKVEWPDEKTVKVTAYLTHRDGHFVTSEFRSSADASGSKNAIQALGSSTSYGRRYTAIDVTGITSREPERRDDDGQGSEMYRVPAVPDGLEAFFKTLEAEAVAGTPALMVAWEKGPPALRSYLVKYRAEAWNGIKAVAAKAGKVKR